MSEQIPRKNKDKKEHPKAGSLFGVLKPRKGKQEETEYVTVREEKRVVRRVVKPKPMARQHASEAFQERALSEKDVKITEEVMESIAPTVSTPPASRKERSFTCVQCGAEVPVGAERCPGCKTHYLRGISEQELRELELAEAAQADDGETMEPIDKDSVPVVHFDAEAGLISYLETDDRDPDFMLECSHCGTAIQFNTDRCPICGTKLESGDTGIVGLFTDMDFDWDDAGEVDCPSCGEHVKLAKGKCPACNETVCVERGKASDKVDPIIHNDNVVFLHLDVESGELNFLQRLARKLGFEQLTVQLEGIGKGGFDQNWQSLTRI